MEQIIFTSCVCLCRSDTDQKFHLCGRHLPQAVQIVCGRRGYNTFSEGKLSNRNWYTSGIVEECCRKACTIDTLEQYCKPEREKQLKIPDLSAVEQVLFNSVKDFEFKFQNKLRTNAMSKPKEQKHPRKPCSCQGKGKIRNSRKGKIEEILPEMYEEEWFSDGRIRNSDSATTPRPVMYNSILIETIRPINLQSLVLIPIKDKKHK